MMTKALELTTSWLEDETTMEIRYHAYLIATGSTAIEHKEPDYAV